MHTHIQCFIQSESSMINELYPSLKGSLDLLFTEFRELSSGVIVLHSKDVALVRLGWGQTAGADKLPGNCNTLWVLTEHNKHVGHVTWRLGPTEPQLSVYCLVFHCSPVKTLCWAPRRVSEWHLRSQMPPESLAPVSQVSFFNRKQTDVS